MNDQCDILVGHGPKVSIIMAKDYKPFEFIPENPYEEEKDDFGLYPKKATVNDRTFERLKKREEELKAEAALSGKMFKKGKKKNKFDIDESFSFDDGHGHTIDLRNKNVKFKGDGDLSDISQSKDNESEEELVTEEMFQKALAQTKLEMEQKIKKKRKSRFRVRKKKQVHMHKRVELKEFSKKEVVQVSRANTSLANYTSLQGSSSNQVLHSKLDSFKKYKPLVTAVPRPLVEPPTIAERIRAAKRLHMTRRDMTEQKIIKNILLHNDPQDVSNFEVLYISNKYDRMMQDQMYHDKAQEQLPKINSKSRNAM